MKNLWRKCLFGICVLFLTMGISGQTFADTQKMSLTATAVSSTKVEIDWNSVEEAGKYEIYRSTLPGGGFQKLDTVSQTTVSYRDTKVKSAVTYYYKVVPVSQTTGQEIADAEQTVKVKTPQKVQITRITVKSPQKMKLYWSQSKGADGYQIYRSNSKNGKYELIDTVTGKNTANYTDSKVTAGKTYYYKIRPTVKNEGTKGYGSYSDPIKGKTVANTTITSLASVNSKALKVTWKKISNATGYEIYRSTKADSGFKKIASVKSSTAKYVDNTVKSGKKYYYKIVTLGKLNGQKITSSYSKTVSFRALQQVTISSVKTTNQDTLKIKWKKVSGATQYKIYRATSSKGSYKKIATVKASSASTQSYTDLSVKNGKTYYYKVQAYSSEDGVIAAGSGDKSQSKSGSLAYAIMGTSTVNVEQMVALYKSSGKSFPSSVYKDKGAKNIDKFCEIVLDECKKEGVKAEVVFAQICLETGYLQFGGQVKAEQCNFSGLGATDDGAAGATFSNVRIGIRAQVQHLKGYASTESLKQACVDPRFIYLSSRRGTAKYVQNLGNGNWATDPDYASKLMNLINQMKSY